MEEIVITEEEITARREASLVRCEEVRSGTAGIAGYLVRNALYDLCQHATYSLDEKGNAYVGSMGRGDILGCRHEYLVGVTGPDGTGYVSGEASVTVFEDGVASQRGVVISSVLAEACENANSH